MSPKFSLRAMTPEERQAVEALTRSRTAEWAKITLAAAAGLSPSAARRLGLSRPTIYTWVRRFNAQGRYGLENKPLTSRPEGSGLALRGHRRGFPITYAKGPSRIKFQLFGTGTG
jgi:transposase-like protein